jgi:hypothetical protein
VSKKPDWKPFLDRGRKRLPRRKTIADGPDRRVPDVYVPKLTPGQINARKKPVREELRGIFIAFVAWGMSEGDGPLVPRLAQTQLLVRRDGRPVFDIDTRIIDDELRESPAWARDFIRHWFKYGTDPEEMAEAFSLGSRQAVYAKLTNVLFYLRGRFDARGIAMHDPGFDIEAI